MPRYHPYRRSRSSYGYRRSALRLYQFPTAYKNELFGPCLKLQAESRNLVLYDRSQAAVVEFAYPMSKGTRIQPTGVRTYFERRRQALECWCGILTDSPAYLNIRTSYGQAVARCSECGVNVSFDDKFGTATLVSDYPMLDRNGPVQPARPSAPRHENPPLPRLRWMSPYHRLPTPPPGNRKYPYDDGQRWRRRTLQFSPMPSDYPDSPGLPSPKSLLKRYSKPQERSPSRYMSLSSPSSSTAAALLSGPSSSAASGSSSLRSSGSTAGSSPSERLQFCDTCCAAWPVRMFSSHVCSP